MSETAVEKVVREHVESILASDPTLFVVEVSLKGSSGNQKLSIFLDGDSGISIDACVNVSRALSGILEEQNLIDGKYYLEVSSSGVDQPLKFARQYKRNIGRQVKVKTLEGQKTEGELKEVSETGFKILKKEKKEEQLIEFNFDQIESTKVLVSFK